MRLAMVGLGKMGSNMTRRLLRSGHEVAVFDVNPDAVGALAGEGAIGTTSLEEVGSRLEAPRVVWVMVPAGEITEDTLSSLAQVLEAGDTIIDGGNSRYTDSMRRAEMLAERGISFLDCGTSGGVWGLDNGYCLMVGGPRPSFEACSPIFETLAPPQMDMRMSVGRGRGTSRRWCTTASNTHSCSPTARVSRSCTRASSISRSVR